MHWNNNKILLLLNSNAERSISEFLFPIYFRLCILSNSESETASRCRHIFHLFRIHIPNFPWKCKLLVGLELMSFSTIVPWPRNRNVLSFAFLSWGVSPNLTGIFFPPQYADESGEINKYIHTCISEIRSVHNKNYLPLFRALSGWEVLLFSSVFLDWWKVFIYL